MKICGIVAEYNPFHNGHLYHVEKTKEQTGAEAVVCVMSGNFIQRGLPALFDKWTRTKMAIQNGVDLVIELPVCYATASAEYFAQGSISLLDSLNVVDTLSFGNSCNDIKILKRIANVLYLEPEGYKKELQKEIKRGVSYPIARSNALTTFLKKEFDEKTLTDILLDSNNILGIEYLKALLYCNSNIEPVAIERKGGNYNSVYVDGNICSATAIREMLYTNKTEQLQAVMPTSSFEIMNSEILSGKSPMFLNHFEREILYELRKNSITDLQDIADVTEGLENVMKKASNECSNIEDLIENIKSKRYTRTRVQRILLHTLLGITKTETEDYKHNPQYIRVLGFTKTGEKILSSITSKSNMPVVTSVSKFFKNANETSAKMMRKDILATDIYTLGYQMPAYKKTNLDYTMPIITT
ncbi:MAG: nucleotidyltransferase [Clostridia bacterium]|nr:nucleotidyltransferase [Clostridia bacterium]